MRANLWFICLALLSTAPAMGAVEAGVDPSVQPGDDFFAYANGEWLKNTDIPAGKERWNARSEIDQLTRQQVAKLLDNVSTAPAGSDARKVADFRAAYVNEAGINASGLAPLKPLLKRIDAVHDKAALTRLLGSMLRADVDPLNWGVYDSSHVLGLSVEAGLHGEKTNVALLVQGGLGLPGREYYAADAPARTQALLTKYQAYIARMLTLAGFNDGEKRAGAVLALESAIAKSHATPEESSEDKNADNLWTRTDFAQGAPGMDWLQFFDAAGLSKQDAFVVWQPSAIKGAAALVQSQPLQAWQDYLRFHAIDRYADVLPQAYAEASFAFHGVEVAGLKQQSPRAQRAQEATQQAMSSAVGRMYVEQYFPRRSKPECKRSRRT